MTTSGYFGGTTINCREWLQSFRHSSLFQPFFTVVKAILQRFPLVGCPSANHAGQLASFLIHNLDCKFNIVRPVKFQKKKGFFVPRTIDRLLIADTRLGGSLGFGENA